MAPMIPSLLSDVNRPAPISFTATYRRNAVFHQQFVVLEPQSLGTTAPGGINAENCNRTAPRAYRNSAPRGPYPESNRKCVRMHLKRRKRLIKRPESSQVPTESSARLKTRPQLTSG